MIYTYNYIIILEFNQEVFTKIYCDFNKNYIPCIKIEKTVRLPGRDVFEKGVAVSYRGSVYNHNNTARYSRGVQTGRECRIVGGEYACCYRSGGTNKLNLTK